jgi:hypothetical protein
MMIFEAREDVEALKHIGLTVAILVGVMIALIITSITIG